MGLTAGMLLKDIRISHAFIGSCTNGRIEDLRAVAKVLEGRKIASHVRGIIVPGSTMVRRRAEEEGLAKIFIAAGFEWRQSGCSMCLAMNEDVLSPGDRCASGTNRNFRTTGRWSKNAFDEPGDGCGGGGRGHLVDVRPLLQAGNKMDTFKQISGRIAPMLEPNIDTDVIMPKQFLKGIDRRGWIKGVFRSSLYGWRPTKS